MTIIEGHRDSFSMMLLALILHSVYLTIYITFDNQSVRQIHNLSVFHGKAFFYLKIRKK